MLINSVWFFWVRVCETWLKISEPKITMSDEPSISAEALAQQVELTSPVKTQVQRSSSLVQRKRSKTKASRKNSFTGIFGRISRDGGKGYLWTAYNCRSRVLFRGTSDLHSGFETTNKYLANRRADTRKFRTGWEEKAPKQHSLAWRSCCIRRPWCLETGWAYLKPSFASCRHYP